MYLEFYGLKEQPFGETPDPRFLYLSRTHREALSALAYGIETGRGFMALVAEPGLGKTTLLYQLMEQTRATARTVFLFQSQFGRAAFFQNLLGALGCPEARGLAEGQKLLQQILVREMQAGRRFILVVDEAQNLDDGVLEEIRMLSNFETAQRKLMHIVLAGQPRLVDRLVQRQLIQLTQRFSIVSRLAPLGRKESAQYVQHRLQVAGYSGKPLFTREGQNLLYAHSAGFPRNLNMLCFNALSLGCARRVRTIDAATVQEAAHDLNVASLPARNAEDRQVFQHSLGAPSNPIRAESLPTLPPFYPTVAIGGEPRRRPSAFLTVVALLALTAFWGSKQDWGQRLAAAVQVAVSGQQSAAATPPSPIPPVESPQAAPGNAEAQEIPNGQNPPAPVETAAGSPETAEEGRPESTLRSTSDAPPAPTDDAGRGREQGNGQAAADDANLGTLVVLADVDGANIFVNGHSEADWKTPRVFSFPPGQYRIAVSKPGLKTTGGNVTVRAGEKNSFRARLRAGLSGALVVETIPSGLKVSINGKPYGTSPVWATLDAGNHQYEVYFPSQREPLVRRFYLKPNQVMRARVEWSAEASQAGEPAPQSESPQPAAGAKKTKWRRPS